MTERTVYISPCTVGLGFCWFDLVVENGSLARIVAIDWFSLVFLVGLLDAAGYAMTETAVHGAPNSRWCGASKNGSRSTWKRSTWYLPFKLRLLECLHFAVYISNRPVSTSMLHRQQHLKHCYLFKLSKQWPEINYSRIQLPHSGSLRKWPRPGVRRGIQSWILETRNGTVGPLPRQKRQWSKS